MTATRSTGPNDTQGRNPSDGQGLRRRLGPGLLTLYGIGVMVGAGIYVLVGQVAAEAGVLAPLAFLVAGLVAAPSALTYAELSVRIPESAGEAAYVREALRSPTISTAVGLVIVGIGVTSAAAVLRGGVGYLTALVGLGPTTLTIVIAVILIGVAVVGVLESLALAAVFTVVELVGLGLVIVAGSGAEPAAAWSAGMPAAIPWSGLGLATVLAFFAFVGFEDIVNLAEEVKRPARTLPIAILVSLVATSLLYGAVSVVAVRAVDPAVLGGSDRPLALVYETGGGFGGERLLAAIAGVAALNGVLAQIVMAARVLFGLGRYNRPLAAFTRTSHRFGTPVTATLVIGSVVIVGSLVGSVESLAELTSSFLLLVFIVMNAALLILKRRQTDGEPGFTVPTWVPAVGLVGSTIALAVATVV